MRYSFGAFALAGLYEAIEQINSGGGDRDQRTQTDPNEDARSKGAQDILGVRGKLAGIVTVKQKAGHGNRENTGDQPSQQRDG
jgi:hypothetical protein